jgi:hypothetical protein
VREQHPGLAPALDLEDAEHRGLHQVVALAGEVGRADPGYGPGQRPSELFCALVRREGCFP